jgi:hypothetical protein
MTLKIFLPGDNIFQVVVRVPRKVSLHHWGKFSNLQELKRKKKEEEIIIKSKRKFRYPGSNKKRVELGKGMEKGFLQYSSLLLFQLKQIVTQFS